jgi:ComF family protein
MTILEILSLKSCLLCLKHGKWICNQCSNHFIPLIPQCYRCRKVSKGFRTHKGCLKKERSNTLSYTPKAIFSGYLYKKETKKYLKYIKFKSSWQMVKEIVQRLVPRITEYFNLNNIKSDNSIIIPVPIHSARHRQRGFNQSEVVAKEISRSSGILSVRSLLRKVRNTKPQTRIERKNRGKNVHGAFVCNYEREVERKVKNIVIIDDVITSGSTIEECTKAIHSTYPKINVYGLVLFRPRKREVRIDKLIPDSNRDKIEA